ncbi:ABC transporter permease [Dactylosporangium sp. NPDC005555]|uniref:ABC transporter permease n=1 Tax=Dactylosporangium sp. NPDC005555 TaxID=3154889 RepID=UPI0033B96217
MAVSQVSAPPAALRVAAGLRRLRPPISGRYLGGRLLTGLIAVWGAVTLVFFALYSTGNPAVLLVPPDAPRDEIDRLTRLMGYDQPLPVQYAKFLGNVATGKFPDSIRYGSDPLQIALAKVPGSFALGVTALLIGVVLGGVLGYVAATARSPVARRLPLGFAVGLEAIPTFFIGILLIMAFAVQLRWFPATADGIGAAGIVLPAITLAIAFVPVIARVFRTALIDVLQAEHIRTARAKGLPRRVIVLRHVVANALGTTLNVVGIQAGVLLGGAVVTESVFNWPGIGQLSINAVQNRDYPLVIVCVLVIAVGFVLINLLVDMLAAVIEPRLRS